MWTLKNKWLSARNWRFIALLFLLVSSISIIFFVTKEHITQKSNSVTDNLLSKVQKIAILKQVNLQIVRDDKKLTHEQWLVSIKRVQEEMQSYVGASLLSLDMKAIRQRLMLIPWVKDVRIDIRLPEDVDIIVEQNQAVALWQHQGQFSWISANGTPITNQNLTAFPELPLIVGTNANNSIGEYFAIRDYLGDAISSQIKAAVRVDDLRWNLVMENGKTIMLSEEYPEDSLYKLLTLQEKYKILQKSLAVIDLRMPYRVIIKKG